MTTLHSSVEERPALSPFTMYLNRVPSPATTAQADPEPSKAQALAQPAVAPSPNFVTCSVLEDLERRFQKPPNP